MSDFTEAAAAAEDQAKKLAEEVKTLRDDLARIGTVVEELLRERANFAASEVGKRAEQAMEDGRKLAGQAAAAVEKNPLQALGAALGIGLLFGLIFGRR